ncbi:MAG TPA: AlpA family phage regulatory protein [Alphaproteobacteria bacterium]|nr:AlpA family phage regulatory protein [Alphaproteobacteria bacterium]
MSDDKLLDSKDLKALGITWSRQHRSNMIAQGLFPAGLHVGPNTVRWLQSDIDIWLAEKKAERSCKWSEARAARLEAEKAAVEAEPANEPRAIGADAPPDEPHQAPTS